MTGNGISAAGSRLSFTFAVRGPCVAVDTACSSSLVATHIATRLIQGEECTDAVSLGSSLILSPRGAFSMFSIAGMLSSHGRCHAFDSRANGY
jgi:acyl transferase domain-containing protein